MQSTHKINSYVVQKMQTTFSQNNIDDDICLITPQYFLADSMPIRESSYLKIKHNFEYICTSCEKKTKKLYSGFCYLCLIKKPEADTCLMSPHRCHYMQGTCRSKEFGDTFCYQPHYLYLAFTDKYKIGLTRHTQVPTRWIDQGATLASPFIKTYSRHQAGILEKFLTQKWADKSHWQNMLKTQNAHPTLDEFKAQVQAVKNWILDHEFWQSNEWQVSAPANFRAEKETLFLPKEEIFKIVYPFSAQLPEKIQSLKLDKSPCIESAVLGLKGQYIVLDNGSVLNFRNHSGFIVDFECNG